jgi:hypothetical protein
VLATSGAQIQQATTLTNWSRNQIIGENSSSAKRSESHKAPIALNQGIQGLGYQSQYGVIGGKFLSNYQRLQSEKARNFFDKESKQIKTAEREKDLLLDGTQLNLNKITA